MPIFVAGAGSWGTALALVLARNGNIVHLWDHNPKRIATLKDTRINSDYLSGFVLPDSIRLFDDLHAALKGTRDLLIVVPSHAFRSVLEQIRPLVKEVRIAWGTKGFDPGSGLLLHQVVAEVFSNDVPVAALSGPSFAREVAAEKPTAVSLAGNDETFMHELRERFHSPHFRVYRNNDLVGLEICGAAKNVLAIAVGICDGLDLGANARCALITRGLTEMARLALAMGGRTETMLSLGGVGDLVLTCTDNQSRNRRFGLAIGRGKKIPEALAEIGQAVEGLSNARELHQLALRQKVEMPITAQVYAVIHQHLSPKQAVKNLLERESKHDEGGVKS